MRGYELWPWASIYTLPYPLFHLRIYVAYLQTTILSFHSDIFIKMLYFVSQIFTSCHNSVSVGKSSAHRVMQLLKTWLLSVTKWSISISLRPRYISWFLYLRCGVLVSRQNNPNVFSIMGCRSPQCSITCKYCLYDNYNLAGMFGIVFMLFQCVLAGDAVQFAGHGCTPSTCMLAWPS